MIKRKMNEDILEEQKKAWGLTRRQLGCLPRRSSQVGSFHEHNLGVPEKQKKLKFIELEIEEVTCLISSGIFVSSSNIVFIVGIPSAIG